MMQSYEAYNAEIVFTDRETENGVLYGITVRWNVLYERMTPQHGQADCHSPIYRTDSMVIDSYFLVIDISLSTRLVPASLLPA